MKGKRRAIVFIVISMLAGIVYLMPFIRFTFYDQMMLALSLTDVQIGALGAVFGTAYVICFPFSGLFSEKLNTKWLLFVSAVGMALTSAWYATLPNYGCLIVIHILYGIFSVGTFWSPYLKAIRNLGDEDDQGKLFGWSDGLRGITNAVISFACLGVMGAMATAAAGFVGACVINAAFAAIIALLIFFCIPNNFDQITTDADKNSDQPKESLFAVAKKVLANPSTWIIIFLIMAGYTIWTTVNSYIGTYCTRVLGLEAGLSSIISIIRTYVLALAAGFVGGWILDKFSSRAKGLFCAFLGVGIFALATMFTSALPILCVVITLVMAFIVYIVKATYWSILGEAGISRENTGMATGVICLIALTPDIFTPPVISRFLEFGENSGNIAVGFNMMFIWLVVWAAIGAIAGILIMRRHRKMLAMKADESSSAVGAVIGVSELVSAEDAADAEDSEKVSEAVAQPMQV